MLRVLLVNLLLAGRLVVALSIASVAVASCSIGGSSDTAVVAVSGGAGSGGANAAGSTSHGGAGGAATAGTGGTTLAGGHSGASSMAGGAGGESNGGASAGRGGVGGGGASSIAGGPSAAAGVGGGGAPTVPSCDELLVSIPNGDLGTFECFDAQSACNDGASCEPMAPVCAVIMLVSFQNDGCEEGKCRYKATSGVCFQGKCEVLDGMPHCCGPNGPYCAGEAGGGGNGDGGSSSPGGMPSTCPSVGMGGSDGASGHDAGPATVACTDVISCPFGSAPTCFDSSTPCTALSDCGTISDVCTANVNLGGVYAFFQPSSCQSGVCQYLVTESVCIYSACDVVSGVAGCCGPSSDGEGSAGSGGYSPCVGSQGGGTAGIGGAGGNLAGESRHERGGSGSTLRSPRPRSSPRILAGRSPRYPPTVRIAFFGLPLAALLLARDGHDLVLVSLSRTDAVGLRRARRVFVDRLLLKPRIDDPALLTRVRDSRPDLLVSWFWTTLLPPSLLTLAPLGTLGVHPSLLPRHRGPDPYFWAIESGDLETGVTAHRLAASYDTGAILAHKRLPIDPRWTSWTLARALDRPSLALLREVTRAFADGSPPPDLPQDESLATSAPAPDDDLSALHFDRPTDAILRRIRALAPSPGAFTEIGEDVLTITEAERAVSFPASLAPGEAAIVADRAIVRTSDGAIVLLRGELEDDGEVRSLAPHDFVSLVLAARLV